MEKKNHLMRAGLLFTAAVLLALSAAAAQNDDEGDRVGLSADRERAAVLHYSASLRSHNPEVRQWTVNHIHVYRFTQLTDDLILVLKNDPVEDVRYAAALALIDIGGKKGRDAVREAAADKSNPKLADFCNILITAKFERED